MLRVSDETPDGAMEPQPKTSFPATLSRWVQEIVLSIPGPARSTLAELMVGAMLAQGGPVTWAVLALTPRLGWEAYHGCSSGAASDCSAWLPHCAASSGA